MRSISDTTFRAFGMLGLRQLLGIVFLMQGIGKVFVWGVPGMVQNYFVGKMGLDSYLPEFLLYGTAYFTSYMELIGGALLILGLWVRPVCALFALLLVIVSFGHGMVDAIWDMEHVIFRAVLLFPLFFLPREWDKYCLDRLFRKKTS